jgi:hypothetical protein
MLMMKRTAAADAADDREDGEDGREVGGRKWKELRAV